MSKFYQAFKLSVIVGCASPFIVCHAGEAAISNSNLVHAFSTFQISPQVGVENHAASPNGKQQLEQEDEGYYPEAGLIQGKDGNIYGTTRYGGVHDKGTVFKVTPDGTVTVLHSFGDSANDGANPQAGMVLGSDGNFYGTTRFGGDYNNGTMFMVALQPDGTVKETVAYSFAYAFTGAYPRTGVIQGKDGNFYGTTYSTGQGFMGAVFRMLRSQPGDFFFVQHEYPFQGPDGANPRASLIQGKDGNFYGTTRSGGVYGKGVAFKIEVNSDGSLKETVLHSFSGGSDGADPRAGLIQGEDGYFYGTTYSGGVNGNGTVFQVKPNGVEVLHAFGGSDDGANPLGDLIQGSDGNFYGTTHSGGTHQIGTVFKVTPSGTETVLYSFGSSGGTDASYPRAGLIQGSDGSFYGTTSAGGTYNVGTVFKVTPSGVETVLCSF
ncbi:hypothetical protein EO087_04375 [Dyella sp. M7H15-1]|uniref:choice-of-anchor tandem repeat GloVer-containing protein n=1 Tax=Dyella sp. M7H15-1 TaxID=2501295 RepID=UPI00100518DA|nr:choice-of-anchor tandem repeat GloVer-containing protein [Dyella sp. M7H15-1]QAU25381.1 hypothetical protein EO087_04375 [Dyella sp. M7H15-1]